MKTKKEHQASSKQDTDADFHPGRRAESAEVRTLVLPANSVITVVVLQEVHQGPEVVDEWPGAHLGATGQRLEGLFPLLGRPRAQQGSVRYKRLFQTDSSTWFACST